jgi:flagellar export protein FliJ
MAFRFSLEAVLRLRQGMERQQELRLRAAHQQVARVRHGIERIDHALGEAEQRSSSTLASGTTSAELRFGLQSEGALLQHREKLGAELTRLAKLRDQQAEIFRRARRERETIESLRDQQLREYKRDTLRREQRKVDDLFLLRRNYQQRG